MLTWAKRVLWALAAAALIYGVFFARLAGQTVASHVADVWRSPVMQKKAGMVREAVKDGLEKKLARLTEEKRGGEAAPTAELSDADRASLDDLIRRVDAPAR